MPAVGEDLQIEFGACVGIFTCYASACRRTQRLVRARAGRDVIPANQTCLELVSTRRSAIVHRGEVAPSVQVIT